MNDAETYAGYATARMQEIVGCLKIASTLGEATFIDLGGGSATTNSGDMLYHDPADPHDFAGKYEPWICRAAVEAGFGRVINIDRFPGVKSDRGLYEHHEFDLAVILKIPSGLRMLTTRLAVRNLAVVHSLGFLGDGMDEMLVSPSLQEAVTKNGGNVDEMRGFLIGQAAQLLIPGGILALENQFYAHSGFVPGKVEL